ncbi:MAG: hypothetical protein PHV74_03430, partial [Dehalococcoidia bacterium]|nr:hypothetical protein [Dehalococcoidia bacterium]
AQDYLAPGVTFAKLDAIAGRMSDNEFAKRMVKARSDLFERISGHDNGLSQAAAHGVIHLSTLFTKKRLL